MVVSERRYFKIIKKDKKSIIYLGNEFELIIKYNNDKLCGKKDFF